MRYEITSTNIFDRWLSRITDRQAVKAILQRLAKVEVGHLESQNNNWSIGELET
jgi:putative component of toxin-antitoxin plasmid stabilization module